MAKWITCSVVAVLAMTTVLVAPAGAQEPGLSEGGASTGAAGRLFDHFVVKGGVITWFILIPLSVATLALIIEHSMTVRRATLLPEPAVRSLWDHLRNKRYVEAVKFASKDTGMVGYVVHTAMGEASRGFAAMERAIEEAIEERSARLFRKIEYLHIIGSVSPMIGLFGTVYGMIRLFASIREAGGIPEPARIADDISIALVTTFWGLLIAIPALSVFALFRNRIDVLSAECALTCERLLSVLKPGQPGPDEAGGAVQGPAAS